MNSRVRAYCEKNFEDEDPLYSLVMLASSNGEFISEEVLRSKHWV